MKRKVGIKNYLYKFFEHAVWGAVEVFPEMVDVKLLSTYPVSREIWCVFVYYPEIQELEPRLSMWTRFWEEFSKKRDDFYSKFKEPGLGYITLYPLFISKEKLEALPNDSYARAAP